MPEDIVPALYEKILKDFNAKVALDPWIKAFLRRVENGTALQNDVLTYAEKLGGYAEEALQRCLSEKNLPDGKIYWNIAKRTIEPLMRIVCNDIGVVDEKVLQATYKKLRLGIKPVGAEFNQDYMNGVMNEIVGLSLYDSDEGPEQGAE